MTVRIAIVGDCANWNLQNGKQDFIPHDIREKIAQCDLFIFNLEGVLASKPVHAQGFTRNPLMRKLLKSIGKLQPAVTSTPDILECLSICKKNIACLGNNHMLDAGSEGIEFTEATLRSKGFLFLGAGKNYTEASKPLIISIKNKRIGIANYNLIGWKKLGIFIDIFGARKDKAGTHYAHRRKIRKEIAELREKTDYVVAIMHVGRVYHPTLTKSEEDFLESLQADVVATHHAHILQDIESSKVFSCGDFIFTSGDMQNRASALLIATDKGVEVQPLVIREGRPYLGPGA